MDDTHVQDALGTHEDFLHLVQLALGLLRHDAMYLKAALGICVIDQAEVLVALINADDLHEGLLGRSHQWWPYHQP